MKRFLVIALLMTAGVLLFVSSAASKRGAPFASANLSLTKIDTPDPVNAGSSLTYTITINNNGPDAAVNASWSDTLPASTTFISLSSPAGWSCSAPDAGDPGTVTCSNLSFPVGSAVFTVTVRAVSSLTPGSVISNTATVTSSTPEGSPGDESGTATTMVTSPSFVQGNKSVSGGTSPGSTAAYIVVLSNAGPSAQADNPGAEFTDVLPADLTLVAADASSGTATANIGTNTVSWNGRIEESDSVTITISATINPGTEGHTVTNQGTINYDADGNGTNQTTVQTNAIGFVVGATPPTADLSLIKTGPSQVQPDTDVSYTITVRNLSSSAAGNASFTDTLPNSVPVGDLMTFVSFSQTSGPTWNCPSPGASTTCTITSLTGNTTSVFTFVGHVPAGTADGKQYTNQTTVTSDSDPNPENDGGATVATVFSCFTDQVVTTNADSGAGSLRQAIIDACDGSTISFDMLQVVSPITLTTGQLLIDKSLTITGPGANVLTTSGNNATRVFKTAPGKTITIADLTITGGNPSGSFPNNQGGGVWNDNANLTLLRCAVSLNNASGDGGGVSNRGFLTVDESIFSGNTSSGFGCGIANFGKLTISE